MGASGIVLVAWSLVVLGWYVSNWPRLQRLQRWPRMRGFDRLGQAVGFTVFPLLVIVLSWRGDDLAIRESLALHDAPWPYSIVFDEPLLMAVSAIGGVCALGGVVAYCITRATCLVIVWVMEGFDANSYEEFDADDYAE